MAVMDYAKTRGANNDPETLDIDSSMFSSLLILIWMGHS